MKNQRNLPVDVSNDQSDGIVLYHSYVYLYTGVVFNKI